MRAVIWEGPGKLAVKEVPVPRPAADEVLIETKAVGICGTDVEIFEGRHEQSQPPLIIGHEGAGVVREVGESVINLKEGDRVVVSPIVYCGVCQCCLRSRYSLCDNLRVIGIKDYPGEYAEFFVAPERNCFKLPDGMEWESSALVDTLAGPITALQRLGALLGAKVAVFGPGPAGLFFTRLSKVWGASEVYLVGTRNERLRLGTQYGADLTVNVREENAVRVIREQTRGEGVDVAIEAAGSAKALREGLEVLRKGGTLLVYGVLGEKLASIDFQDLLLRELTLFGVADNTQGYPLAIHLIHSSVVPVKPLLTHVIKLSELPDFFNCGTIQKRKEGYIKGVVSLW